MANNLNLTPEALSKYVGRPITDICTLGFGTVGYEHNHCAHFVGHVLRLNTEANVGTTCAHMIWKGLEKGADSACIRVNELFNRVADLAAADEKGCLIYVTVPSNIKEENGIWVMGSQKRKHVGIYLGGEVWHYGNTKDKVKRQKLDEFEGDFQKVYSPDIVIRYTIFPKSAEFQEFTEPVKKAAKKK
jgi:hypothetical protein